MRGRQARHDSWHRLIIRFSTQMRGHLVMFEALTLVAAFAAGTASTLHAQQQTSGASGASSASGASGASRAEGGRAWTVPRTPDGRPDLQGIWTNATLTPLERPRQLGERRFFSE